MCKRNISPAKLTIFFLNLVYIKNYLHYARGEDGKRHLSA